MTRRRLVPGPIGRDVDLDKEEVYLQDGTRLTEASAQELAEWAMAEHYRKRGRPSVSGGAERTPNLTVRVSKSTRAAMERIAKARGRRLSDVSREAFEEYVARHTDGERTRRRAQ